MIVGQSVECIVRDEIPFENETIEDDIDIKSLCKFISGFNVYRRDEMNYPVLRGNWIIDFLDKNDIFLCLKLPVEMTESQVQSWIKPLADRFKLIKN